MAAKLSLSRVHEIVEDALVKDLGWAISPWPFDLIDETPSNDLSVGTFAIAIVESVPWSETVRQIRGAQTRGTMVLTTVAIRHIQLMRGDAAVPDYRAGLDADLAALRVVLRRKLTGTDPSNFQLVGIGDRAVIGAGTRYAATITVAIPHRLEI